MGFGGISEGAVPSVGRGRYVSVLGKHLPLASETMPHSAIRVILSSCACAFAHG